MVPTLEQDGINHGFYEGSEVNAALSNDWNENLKAGMGVSRDRGQKAFASIACNFSLIGYTYNTRWAQ